MPPTPPSALPPFTPTLLGDNDSDEEEDVRLAALLEQARQAARRADIDPLRRQKDTVLFDMEDAEDEEEASSSSRPAPLARAQAGSRSSAFLERPLTAADLADAAPATARSKDKGKEVDHTQAMLDKTATRWNTMPPTKLSKKQRKAARPHTTGAAWFDMPAPELTPQLKREVQAMRLAGALDPKHFQRGEAKRERGKMPEFFQLGHVIDSRGPASTTASAPAARKRSFVDALVEDTEARAYARKKFKEVQDRAASGRKRFTSKSRRRS